ncbi:hypothetical protein IFM89_019498 [Coptis chinensis]|uniref:Uncharacterized protein n=1 Tax=Coptis chinensis TaxID=261450 RepID=A0A835H088_9MAGN|nr:hypothetical protein IFM89_019498 [Coptis chinensis]
MQVQLAGARNPIGANSILANYWGVRPKRCILSKRWRSLWTSLPFLNFNTQEDLDYDKPRDKIDFMKKVLYGRDDQSNIHTFHHYTFYSHYDFHCATPVDSIFNNPGSIILTMVRTKI